MREHFGCDETHITLDKCHCLNLMFDSNALLQNLSLPHDSHLSLSLISNHPVLEKESRRSNELQYFTSAADFITLADTACINVLIAKLIFRL